MSEIPYTEIELQLQNILQKSLNPSDCERETYVTVEDIPETLDTTPLLVIELDSAETASSQAIARGRVDAEEITINIICYDVSVDSRFDAARRRDSLVGTVKTILMANRTINDTVEMGWLAGGTFDSGALDHGFYASYSINFVVRASARI